MCPADCMVCSTVYMWSTDLKQQVEVTKFLEKGGSREQVASFPQLVLQASAYFLKIPALNWIYSAWSKVTMNMQNRWFGAYSHFISKLWTVFFLEFSIKLINILSEYFEQFGEIVLYSLSLHIRSWKIVVQVPLSVRAQFQARKHFMPHPLPNAVGCFELYLFQHYSKCNWRKWDILPFVRLDPRCSRWASRKQICEKFGVRLRDTGKDKI